MILVNTIGHIKSGLHLDDKYYGWVMAAFGVGAAVAAFVAGSIDKTPTRAISLISGALLLGLSVCFANIVSYNILIGLWLFAGLGQSLAEMPSETLIAETIQSGDQGKYTGRILPFLTYGGPSPTPLQDLLEPGILKKNFSMVAYLPY